MTSPAPRLRHSGLRYAAAIFLSSSLLFLIEPIAGKRLLPLLGGSAAVWTACLVFFQCALLLGYLTAHWLVTRAGARVQIIVYVTLLALSVLQVVVAITASPAASATHPITSVLWLLTVLIGVPFVTLSATSPLLQSWHARSAAHAVTAEGAEGEAAHPYWLFAVSNVGSLLALLIYPWLIEPRMGLRAQTAAVAIGFAALAAICGAIAYSMRTVPVLHGVTSAPAAPEMMADQGDGASDRMLWVALAACGSLLLSAITNHISLHVAPIPLLWTMPLVVYLLTFVVAFGGDRWRPRWLSIGVAFASLGFITVLLWQGLPGGVDTDDAVYYQSIVRVIAVFCGALFGLCWFCHSELYRRRPAPRYLTTFYACVAAGGALGAILVGVVAPLVLPGDYELAIGLWFVALLGLAVTWASGTFARIAWAIASLLTLTLVAVQVKSDRISSLPPVRNFYGTLHVTEQPAVGTQAAIRRLVNGVINHGEQVMSPELQNEPTTYYGHPSGVGLALDLCCDDYPRRVGVIGLGTGTLAAYGRPGDVFRFYDINPAVEPIARKYFTYLHDSRAHIEVVTGDARLSLSAEAPQAYDVLAIDAFSGDAIPVHLMTVEALALYRRHVKPHGIIAFHVSNRFLDLAPVVELLARQAGLKTALISSDDNLSLTLFTADWVLVTNDDQFLAQQAVDGKKAPIVVPAGLRPWTDDYSSLLPVLRLRKSP